MTTGQDSPDPAVVALGRALERAVRRVDALDAGLRTLADDVRAAATASTSPATAAEDAGPAVRSWLEGTDSDQATADLADLVDWIDRVFLRYTRAALSSCWLWHPEAIEELWWLRCAHAEAYHPQNGSWLRVGDWHDRQRPGVQNRLNALLGKCGLSRHVDRNGHRATVTEPLPAALGVHHAAVASAWTSFRSAGPIPTSGQLSEADQYETARHRTH